MKWEYRLRPSNVPELLAILDGVADVHFWRGSADLAWPLDSTVVRRLRLRKWSRESESYVQSAEKLLLERARHRGFDIIDGQRLSDFELLALLRHHGAATRLVDFSRSALIALWFACSSQPETDGELLGVCATYVYGGTEGMRLTGVDGKDESYSSVVDQVRNLPGRAPGKPEFGLWQWQPPTLSSRVASQASQFLFSTLVDEPHGSVYLPTEDSDAVLVIDIAAGLKPKVLSFLEKVLDVRFLTLFPDVHGFSTAYGVTGDETDRW